MVLRAFSRYTLFPSNSFSTGHRSCDSRSSTLKSIGCCGGPSTGSRLLMVRSPFVAGDSSSVYAAEMRRMVLVFLFLSGRCFDGGAVNSGRFAGTKKCTLIYR